ncbi:MAG: adenosine kinase [bacterium]|nr:adenosine kinase [bacterium]
MKYDVYGLGNPLVDVIVNIDEDMHRELGLEKGTMNLVDMERQSHILEHTKNKTPLIALGGSCANSMVMIAQLGGKAAFCGNLGNDELAKEYEDQLIKAGVDSHTSKGVGMTGSTVILVAPDAERTMNTHLGQCQELSKEAVNLEAIQLSKYLYVEGYLWDTPKQQEAVLHALEHAKKHGVKIALSLSDAFVVGRHREAFEDLLKNYVDLVFCNEMEAEHMTGEKDPVKMSELLHQWVPHVVLTMGKKGSRILLDGTLYEVDAVSVDAIDTTGAGDSFAAGYLFGLTQGYEIAEAGRLASGSAAAVVSQMGPRYQGDLKEKLKGQIK